MIAAHRLGYASFETPDLEKSVAYYTGTCGLVVAARERDRAFLATRLGQLAILLSLGSESRCTGLSFEVSPDISFADAERSLAAHGLKYQQRRNAAPGIAKALAFADPKGTTI